MHLNVWERSMKTMMKLQVAAAASALFALAGSSHSETNVGVDSASPGHDPNRKVDQPEGNLTITGQHHQTGAPIQDNAIVRDLALKHLDDTPARRGCATEQANTLNVRKTDNKVRRPRTNRIGTDTSVCVTPQGLGEQSLHRDAAGFHDVTLATH